LKKLGQATGWYVQKLRIKLVSKQQYTVTIVVEVVVWCGAPSMRAEITLDLRGKKQNIV